MGWQIQEQVLSDSSVVSKTSLKEEAVFGSHSGLEWPVSPSSPGFRGFLWVCITPQIMCVSELQQSEGRQTAIWTVTVLEQGCVWDLCWEHRTRIKKFENYHSSLVSSLVYGRRDSHLGIRQIAKPISRRLSKSFLPLTSNKTHEYTHCSDEKGIQNCEIEMGRVRLTRWEWEEWASGQLKMTVMWAWWCTPCRHKSLPKQILSTVTVM